MGRAKSCAERLFTLPEIGPLDQTAARAALVKPAAEEGVAFEAAALSLIVRERQGHPYFIQA